jgi:GR25 family glycosyltransferase involved in LPS biosynthesis
MAQELPQLPVYIINLDSRSDRWALIRKECLSCGVQPTRISAVKASPGWHGCAKSHQKVQAIAQQAGHSWYLILEDDATFSINDWRRFIEMLPFLWQHRAEWDIFNGGCGKPNEVKLLYKNPLLYSVKGPCTQFLLVNQNAYSVIKAWKEDDGHVDWYLTNNTRMVGTYPFVAYQTESQSDIGIGNPANEITIGQELIKQHILRDFQTLP